MKKSLVWDIPTRVFHWALVAAVVTQWITAELTDDLTTHSYVGYGVIGLLVFRLAWGIVGTRYARFSDFIRSPRQAVKELSDDSASQPTGHSTMGGWMIITMLLLLISQAVSGLFITDDVLFTGLYYDNVSSDIQSTMGWIHHNAFSVIQWLVALHIAAALWYQFKKRIPIISAMLHGKKEINEEDAISDSRIILAIIVLLLSALAIYLMIDLAPEPEEDFYF